MITLITGGPGAGKTALALAIYLDEYKGRPLFSNVRGLTLDHSPLPKLEEWTIEEFNDQGTSEFRFTFPENAVILIDEAQQFYRPRATGSRVPPYVQAFETHRHEGIDFILLTQHSSFLDANVRKLIKNARHIFIKPGFLGRFRFERADLINEDDKADLALCKKSKYILPKHVFGLYKSSKLHTKPRRPGLPFQAYVLMGSVVAVVGLGWSLYGRMSDKFGGAQPVAEAVQGATPPAGAAIPGAVPASPGVLRAAPASIIEATTPTDPHNPLSAPLYAAVLPPVVAPEVVGCIASASRCACYSQQQTPVWMPEDQCRQRVAGEYYDPYRVMPRGREETMPRTAEAAFGEVREVQPAPASETPSATL